MIKQYSKTFHEPVEWLKTEFKAVQAGKASPLMLDGVYIEAYGSQTPISNVASVTLEDARTLRVSPWDKDHVKLIENAIRDNGLPFSVVGDSNGLRVIVPQMTEENRKKIVKQAGQLHEEARIRVRKIRQDANDEIDAALKAKEINEDEARSYKSDIQNMVDTANKSLDEVYAEKETDIMSI